MLKSVGAQARPQAAAVVEDVLERSLLDGRGVLGLKADKLVETADSGESVVASKN